MANINDEVMSKVAGGNDTATEYIFRKDVEYRKNRGWISAPKKCARCKNRFISLYGENICEDCDRILGEQLLTAEHGNLEIRPVDIDDIYIKKEIDYGKR